MFQCYCDIGLKLALDRETTTSIVYVVHESLFVANINKYLNAV
jgi:hypothetical protein